MIKKMTNQEFPKEKKLTDEQKLIIGNGCELCFRVCGAKPYTSVSFNNYAPIG